MDRRDYERPWWAQVDKGRMVAEVARDYDERVWIPFEYEVCDLCGGKGTMVNPNIDRNGLTHEDFDEMGPEFEEDYFRGVYDQPCARCDGDRVMPVPTTAEGIQLVDEIERERYEIYAEQEAERRFCYGPDY
jgi:hypothetical protein